MPDETSDDAEDETELTFDRLVIELVGVDELLDVALVFAGCFVFEIIEGGSGARRSPNVVGRRADALPLIESDDDVAAESDCDDVDAVGDVAAVVFSNFSLISLIL